VSGEDRLEKELKMVRKADQIKSVGVVGAGLMGHGIAQAYAQEGYPVTITDESKPALAGVKNRIKANLETLVQEKMLRQNEIEQVLERITVTESLEKTVRDADFVTEAIFEDLEIKRRLFHEMEKFCSPECILASNTSSFPMTQISALMKRPERAIVTHWMNPPYLVPLVEVVPGKKTSTETYDTADKLLRKIKKVPVKVEKEIIGFLINRIQTAMNREVYYLLEIGAASAEDIDLAVVTSLGFRLATQGPLQIRDLAGLDVTSKVDEILLDKISSSQTVSKLLKEKVSRGELGAKTGKGFFEYTPESLAAIIRERDRQFIRLLKEQYLPKV
jgi:3-hydroxybutyryl-CoA dehydrogenase